MSELTRREILVLAMEETRNKMISFDNYRTSNHHVALLLAFQATEMERHIGCLERAIKAIDGGYSDNEHEGLVTWALAKSEVGALVEIAHIIDTRFNQLTEDGLTERELKELLVQLARLMDELDDKYSQKYEEGHKDGHEEGYSDGYDNGVDAGRAESNED